MKAQPPNAPGTSSATCPAKDFLHPDDPNWDWLEQRDDDNVKAFLAAANTESDAWFTPLIPLAEQLYQGHLARRELSVKGLPTPLDHYTVWSETAADADYPLWWRHPNGNSTAKECFFDLETRAHQHTFFELGDMTLSPDEEWLAWSEDTQGDETYQLYLKRLPDGEPQLLLEQIGPELCWAEDNSTLLFTRYDATQRPDSVWRLTLDLSDPAGSIHFPPPQLILREDDPQFWVGLGKTRSRAWLIIESASKDTSETHLVPAAYPATPTLCILPRQPGVEYALDHRPGAFYLLHNRNAVHFQLDVIDEDLAISSSPDIAAMTQVLLPHRQDVTLEGVDAYSWGLVVTERDHEQAQLHLHRIELDAEGNICLDEPLPCSTGLLSIGMADSPHFDTRTLRLREESFTTPPSWWEVSLDSATRTLLKRQTVHGDLTPQDLVCDRIWATSHDGERVPVSIVRRADLANQAMPTLLYGYGAYGEALDPWFSISRLELLQRGIAFAVAHVRGGGERGEPWYLAGKLEHKTNSFEDFLAARDALVEHGLADAERIVAYGASAGGLLVGASINAAPGAFCAAVLDVPFVDVLRTMNNPDLPLTTAEYTEWGDPQEPAAARRIRSYSPLDNLATADWPAVFLQGSWHDTRVPYWEPAKLYARLSMANINHPGLSNRPVLLRTDMEAGHGGASGRFKAWRDGARQDAFILWAMGLADDGKHIDFSSPLTHA